MKFKLNIPESLSEIKLKDYQKYLKVVEDNPEATEFINIKLVEIFCHIKINDVNAIKVNDFTDIVNDIGKVFDIKKKFKQRFYYDGVEYGFIPDLENISMGEYIDLNTYLSSADTFHKAMAVLYRPITTKIKDMYLIEDYETAAKYEAIMREAPVDIFMGANVFFYNLGKELVKHTLNSLENLATKDSQLQRILAENGDGIQAFTQLLEADFGDLMMSRN